MRIAQVSPLFESVPPKCYGGTERVVSYLTEELVRQGHRVTLFASGDSDTQAELVPCCPRSLRLDEGCVDRMAHHVVMLEKVLRRANDFDVIHFHIDYLHYPLSRRFGPPHLTTLHGRLDLPDLQPLYDAFPDQPVVSISNDQRRPLPQANWVGTGYHGLPPDLLTFRPNPGDYLACLCRISPEKGVDEAIRIALKAGVPLKIAAKVDAADRDYHRDVVAPMIREAGAAVEFLGEIGGKDKDEFLGRARALLFPINWSEPFGLAMIEAMACGTPVIAYSRGSVPEVVDDGVTGFVVRDIDEAVAAIRGIDRFDRTACRRRFEARFDAARMARDYVAVYERLLGTSRPPAPSWPGRPGSLQALADGVPAFGITALALSGAAGGAPNGEVA